ncbi:MAG TPA: PIN domain-containing protein [Thermoanaerobaculia bacterium]|jgi:predicted nucleic acid-binding protein
MLPKYFADTWFFVALMDRRDSHHGAVRRMVPRLSAVEIVTHDFVLTEVLANFSDDGPAARALAVSRVRDAAVRYNVVPATRTLFIAGLERYASRPDKEWSHVDCMSMVLMEQRGITHVLTNDHHFAQAGFTLVNE